MDILTAIILGVVQGITEWLPVSSSAHLVILQHLFGYQNSVTFDIMVHAGTLLAVVLYFWKDVIMLIKNFFLTFVEVFKIGKKAFTKDEDRRITWYIVIATIPIVVVGLALQDYVDEIFNSLLLVGIALIITGLWLISTIKKDGKEDVNLKNTTIIGLAQAAAIFPGISRSGSTIATGMLQNMDKAKAARFSFLLSIPAVGGAFTLEFVKTPLHEMLLTPNLVGFFASFIVGILTIHFLLGVIKRGKFYMFAFYCWALGAAVVVYSLFI